MHELSIAQALIEQVEETAVRESAKRVERVTIVVGTLSGVDSDALRTLFPLVSEGTLAADAGLVIEEVKAQVKCKDCGNEESAELTFTGCSVCGSRQVELIAGRELNIKSIELEVDGR